jgi:MarR family transcriptional regulator, organic hydroperoxide resistance regulator
VAAEPTISEAPDALAEGSPDAFAAAWEGFFLAVRRAKGRASARPPAAGLSLAQYHLLAPLSHGGAQTIRALAAAAGVAAPTATRMLDGLDRDGLVTRTPSATDRRCVTVALTTKGRRALDRTHASIAAARARIADSLSAEEREQATALLRRLAVVVEEQLP